MRVAQKFLPKAIVLMITAIALFHGCNCEDEIGTGYEMNIKILSPSGSTISFGQVQFRVSDDDGLEFVEVKIDDKVIEKKDTKGDLSVTHTTKFDLGEQPDSFKITVFAKDLRGDTDKVELKVNKETGGPILTFLEPTKLDPKHSAIFVGRKAGVKVQARDSNGTDGITIQMGAKGPEKVVRKCQTSKEPSKKEFCTTDVDFSGDDYKNGKYYIFADAKDTKGNPAVRAIRTVIVDKEGPQISIVTPADAAQVAESQVFRAIILDQVGIKKVHFFVGKEELKDVKPSEKANEKGHYLVSKKISEFATRGKQKFLVQAWDNLDNKSEKFVTIQLGCQTDGDCAHKPGTRCCAGDGVCYPTVAQEGAVCDPCKNPCGKSADGTLMGCVAGVCDRKPYRCRKACKLGSPTEMPEQCAPKKSDGTPAEYCKQSDITKINPQLGACGIGDNCDPLKNNVCPPGAQPPYNNCCPKDMGCFPQDQDANLCEPVGKKKLADTHCTSDPCSGLASNCAAGLNCITIVDENGKPTGPASCRKMCTCDRNCRSGLFRTRKECPRGQLCTPVYKTNSNNVFPIGVCR